MKLSDYIVQFLKNKGITTIFGYQGGAITHFVDSIFEEDGIRFISTYHEQSAAFAAESYSRISGNIGVATATSGPGATNLITGIGSAFFDSIPCLYITGQVNTYEYKKSDKLRQAGFQETDIVNIVKSITKYSVMVKEPEKIRYCLEKASYIAKSGRPGPVLIDVPMNIQRAEINVDELISFYDTDEYRDLVNEKFDIDKIDDVIDLIKACKRPVILAGGGVRLADACDQLKEIADITGIPVVSTLMGIDCMNNENYIGFIGAYGNRYSNFTVANSDLLIVLGSRLTSRQTSTMYDSFAREAKIVHVDIDKNELNRTLKEQLSIYCDLKIFVNTLRQLITSRKLTLDYADWRKKIESYKDKYPSYPTQKEFNELDPNEFMHKLGQMLQEDTVICLDIGQNQIWASQSIKLKKNQRLINAGGMGPMGYSLPAAIGAYFAQPNYKIVSISGDGGIQMNIQELQTIVREKIPVKIIIINNKALGMIRHFQEMYFDSRYHGTIEGYSTPDFIKISQAYGIDALKITNENELDKLQEILKDNKSYVIEVELNSKTYVIPKLAMGRPIEDQEPLLDREEFKKNMIIKTYEQ